MRPKQETGVIYAIVATPESLSRVTKAEMALIALTACVSTSVLIAAARSLFLNGICTDQYENMNSKTKKPSNMLGFFVK